MYANWINREKVDLSEKATTEVNNGSPRDFTPDFSEDDHPSLPELPLTLWAGDCEFNLPELQLNLVRIDIYLIDTDQGDHRRRTYSIILGISCQGHKTFFELLLDTISLKAVDHALLRRLTRLSLSHLQDILCRT